MAGLNQLEEDRKLGFQNGMVREKNDLPKQKNTCKETREKEEETKEKYTRLRPKEKGKEKLKEVHKEARVQNKGRGGGEKRFKERKGEEQNVKKEERIKREVEVRNKKMGPGVATQVVGGKGDRQVGGQGQATTSDAANRGEKTQKRQDDNGSNEESYSLLDISSLNISQPNKNDSLYQ